MGDLDNELGSPRHPGASDTQRLMLEEIEKHTIIFVPEDTLGTKLDKIATNLNGKTEGLAKMRRGQTKLMAEIKLMPTLEQFESVKVLVDAHEARWVRFDILCADILIFVNKVWKEIKDTLWKGFKNGVILFITAIVLWFLWAMLDHYYPGASSHIPKVAP